MMTVMRMSCAFVLAGLCSCNRTTAQSTRAFEDVVQSSDAARDAEAEPAPAPTAMLTSPDEIGDVAKQLCWNRPGGPEGARFDRQAAGDAAFRAAAEARQCPRRGAESKGKILFAICGDGTVAAVAFDTGRRRPVPSAKPNRGGPPRDDPPMRLSDEELRSEWAACVVEAFSRARIPPFFGDPIVIHKHF
jgi:hypothetical protein